MTGDAVIEAIRSVVDAHTFRGTRVYLFGSFTRANACWSDIDVLIVTDLDTEGQILRKALSEICLLYPIDLQVMTTSEEAEFDFVRSENCQQLTSFSRRTILTDPVVAKVASSSQLSCPDECLLLTAAYPKAD